MFGSTVILVQSAGVVNAHLNRALGLVVQVERTARGPLATAPDLFDRCPERLELDAQIAQRLSRDTFTFAHKP